MRKYQEHKYAGGYMPKGINMSDSGAVARWYRQQYAGHYVPKGINTSDAETPEDRRRKHVLAGGSPTHGNYTSNATAANGSEARGDRHKTALAGGSSPRGNRTR